MSSKWFLSFSVILISLAVIVPASISAATGAVTIIASADSEQRRKGEAERKAWADEVELNSVYIAKATQSLLDYFNKHKSYPVNYYAWLETSPELNKTINTAPGVFSYKRKSPKEASLSYSDVSSPFQEITSYEVLLFDTPTGFLSLNGAPITWGFSQYLKANPAAQDFAAYQTLNSTNYEQFLKEETESESSSKPVRGVWLYIIVAMLLTLVIVIITCLILDRKNKKFQTLD